MKYLVIAGVVALSACAGYQTKIDNAQAKAKDIKEKVVCRAKVLTPYLDYVIEADLPALLDGASIEDILAVSGEAKEKAEEVKAAFAACGKLTLK